MKAEVREWGSLRNIRGPIAVGIDQSLTGFALTAVTLDGRHHQTSVLTSPKRGIDRLQHIYDWCSQELDDLHSCWRVTDVAVESPVRMSHSALISGELWAIVRLACLHGLGGDHPGGYPLQVAPSMLKKYVTGKGTGVQKNQMLLHVYKKWDVEFDDDNAADSYGLARIATGNGETKYEQEVLDKLRDPKYRDRAS